MKGKIIIGSILAVLLLVTISYATAINTKDIEEKESPLYKLRTRMATCEKISNIIENIETKFLGERIFLLPLHWINERGYLSLRGQIGDILKVGKAKLTYYPTGCSLTCKLTCK